MSRNSARSKRCWTGPDPELLGWVIGLRPVPPEFDTDVMAMLKAYKSAL